MGAPLNGGATVADHQYRQLVLGNLAAGAMRDDAAAAKHGDPIGDGERLGEFVGDQDYNPALATQPLQHLEKRGQLARREQSGGLVEDQHARLKAERA